MFLGNQIIVLERFLIMWHWRCWKFSFKWKKKQKHFKIYYNTKLFKFV